MNERRTRRFLLHLHQIQAILRGEAAVKRPLPADATVLFGEWSPSLGGFIVTVRSAEYEPVEANVPTPFTWNSPAIEAK